MKTSKERRAENNEKIKSMGIFCFEDLPVRESSEEVKLKSFDEICKRAIASLIVIQIAYDTNRGEFEEGKHFFAPMLEKYGVADELISKEQELFNGNYNKQLVLDVAWTYECYWSLVWALGLVDDITDASDVCDSRKAIELVAQCENYEDFKSKCKLRNIEEILDMIDLYYRYHWATVEKMLYPEKDIGNLDVEVVPERRRGLEWLISDEDDWFEIDLKTHLISKFKLGGQNVNENHSHLRSIRLGNFYIRQIYQR